MQNATTLQPAKAERLKNETSRIGCVDGALVEHEEDREQERGGEQQVDPEVPVARRLALDDGERGRCESTGPEKEAGEVQAEADRVGALGQDQRRADERDQSEEQVEPEDGPERVEAYQHAADQAGPWRARDRKPPPRSRAPSHGSAVRGRGGGSSRGCPARRPPHRDP